MKAVLIFNLPEDNELFQQANNAGNYQNILSEFDRYLRDEIKYNGNASCEPIREKLRQIIEENIKSELWN